MSKITSVRIRMYDTGSVGDCLLLLFMKGEEISFSMMVDCGGWNTTAAAVKPCVEDIVKTCDKKLNLLVLTHQHEDHVSGFNLARGLFEQLKVGQVWMSWMENPEDAIAKIVKDKYGKKIKTTMREVLSLTAKLKQAARRSYAVTTTRKRFNLKAKYAENALALLQFELGSDYGRRLTRGAQTNQQAIDFVRKKAGKPKYWKPGQVVMDLPGAEGIKFFMLGPPRDKDMKLFFTKVEVESEIYKIARAAKAAADEEKAEIPLSLMRSGTALRENESPFATKYKMDAAELRAWKKIYNDDDHNWRQIETDSEELSLGIALQANRYTNNTSFAMAIELENGQVILLPGDAQSGNWMGWHKPDVMESLKKNGGKDTKELLESTVFYKIGHHCSKNGTASISGLENMNSPDLVGFIPLVKSKVPDAWHPEGFPAKPLYRQLIAKTSGRLIRTDEGIIKDARAERLRSELPSKERKKFENAYRKGSCFHEYTISTK